MSRVLDGWSVMLDSLAGETEIVTAPLLILLLLLRTVSSAPIRDSLTINGENSAKFGTVTVVSVLVYADPLILKVDMAGGLDANSGTHTNEMLTNRRVGSLVDSTRVSKNGAWAVCGTVQVTLIAIVNVDDIEIGSTGDEIENHDP